jgi:hypothetical protein
VVKRLIRVQYGPYRLADLPAGAVLEVRPKSFKADAHNKPRKATPTKKKTTTEKEVRSGETGEQ